MRLRYVGSVRRTTLSCTVDSHGVSAHLLERVLRVCMDVSMTTLSCGGASYQFGDDGMASYDRHLHPHPSSASSSTK